jgi:hypothetical protein
MVGNPFSMGRLVFYAQNASNLVSPSGAMIFVVVFILKVELLQISPPRWGFKTSINTQYADSQFIQL